MPKFQSVISSIYESDLFNVKKKNRSVFVNLLVVIMNKLVLDKQADFCDFILCH